MKRICLFMSVRMRERASRSATQIKAVDFPLKCSRFTFSSLWKGSGATTPKTTTAPVSQIDTLSFPFQPKSQLLQKSPFLLALSSLAVTSETWINLTGYTEVLWEWLCLHMPLSVQICIVWHTCAHTHKCRSDSVSRQHHWSSHDEMQRRPAPKQPVRFYLHLKPVSTG